VEVLYGEQSEQPNVKDARVSYGMGDNIAVAHLMTVDGNSTKSGHGT
jgi:hypothetical protein